MNTIQLYVPTEEEFVGVNKFYKACREKSRVQKGERVVVAVKGARPLAVQKLVEENIQIVAAVRLLPLTSAKCTWWLRSLYVAPSYRQQGIAGQLTRRAIKEIKGSCYCFPFSHLSQLYERVGFIECGIKNLPDELKGRFERYAGGGKKILAMAVEC